MFHQALLQSLAEAGHQITYVAPLSMFKEIKNFKYVNSRPKKSGNDQKPPTFIAQNEPWTYILGTAIEGMLEEDCYDFMNSEEVQVSAEVGSNYLYLPNCKIEGVHMYERCAKSKVQDYRLD